MPPPPATPEQIAKALTLRAAASMLTKSPVWTVIVAFMQQRLAALNADILDNASLSDTLLHDRRTQRFYLRELLTEFRADFHRAFTSPPVTDDESLQKMAVPPEVAAALEALLSPSQSLHVSQATRPPAPADPKNIDPFTGSPPVPPTL